MQLTAHTLLERTWNESHLDLVAEQLVSALEKRPTLIMTGRAQSIQALQRKLLSANARPREKFVKAYWSVGKRGLD